MAVRVEADAISTRTPHVGSDKAVRAAVNHHVISTRTPRVGSDRLRALVEGKYLISTRTHRVGSDMEHKTGGVAQQVITVSIPSTSLPQERWITVQISPYATGEQKSLHMRHKSSWDLFPQERMSDRILLPILPGSEQGFSPLFSQANLSGFPHLEMRRIHNTIVDGRQHEPVDEHRPQLFHQVQG